MCASRQTVHLRLRGKIRRGSLARGFTGRFTTAAIRDHVHLLAFRAGALHVGKTRAGAMTTAQANVAVFRPAKHAAELAAQNTIGTAYDPFRHFSRTLLPLTPGALDPGRRSRRVRTRGGRRGTTSFRFFACAVKVNTKVIASGMKMARKLERIPRWCPQLPEAGKERDKGATTS